MKSILKTGLLASVSLVALGVMATSPAHAFDKLEWKWEETIRPYISVNVDLDPAGLVVVESLQTSIGDVKAKSDIYGVANNTVSGNLNAVTELPSVVGAATAVANNFSVDSDVGTQVHVGQFALGDGDSSWAAQHPLGAGDSHGHSDNSNLTLSHTMTDLALDRALDRANIEAHSTVGDILNASVDSSATAVGNNVSIAVAPNAPSNALLMADITQFTYANVTATSKVNDVTVKKYTNLGVITSPIVNSVATAVGNNASVTIKTPVIAP